MKLYGRLGSPYVRHCRIALLQTRQPFDFVPTENAESIQLSPTARVPFLEDGDERLFDSTSIVAHVRRKAGQEFSLTPAELDSYCLANTAMDAGIVLLMSKWLDGADESGSAFLTRTRTRLENCLRELETRAATFEPLESDVTIRVVCLLEWGLYRRVFSLDPHPRLTSLLRKSAAISVFAETQPEG